MLSFVKSKSIFAPSILILSNSSLCFFSSAVIFAFAASVIACSSSFCFSKTSPRFAPSCFNCAIFDFASASIAFFSFSKPSSILSTVSFWISSVYLKSNASCCFLNSCLFLSASSAFFCASSARFFASSDAFLASSAAFFAISPRLLASNSACSCKSAFVSSPSFLATAILFLYHFERVA